MLYFFVPGKPTGLKRHRDVKQAGGGRFRYDPSKQDKADFLAKCMEHRPDVPMDGPLRLDVICVFPRPKSHYRTGRHATGLRDDAPFWHTSTPDADNLLKFVGDTLNAIFWKDDKQIVSAKTLKAYGDRPGVHVRISVPAILDRSFVEAMTVEERATRERSPSPSCSQPTT